MCVQVGLGEAAHARERRRNHGDLDVAGLEIHAAYLLQAVDGLLDVLLLREVHVLLHDLLQGVHRLGVLLARGRRLHPVAEARRVDLVERGTLLVVHGHEEGVDAVRPHVGVLGVDLPDVGELQREVVHGDLVAVLVLELRGDVARPERQRAPVGCDARHQAADVGRDVVDAGDVVLVHQLVGHLLLGHKNDAVLAAEGQRGRAPRLRGLDGVLHLVQPALGREDGDVAVVPGLARHRLRGLAQPGGVVQKLELVPEPE
mmetsp:Transcript_82890/g.235136  ORF Transcript_82890/g.235136 Transcript_82890/m.235136 type:complete len:259 (-) Transcript_82890:2-778(-)